VPRFCRNHSEYLAARIEVRIAEPRVLAAEAALETVLEQRPLWTRWLLEPLQARSLEQAWRAEVQRQTRRLEAAVRRRQSAG